MLIDPFLLLVWAACFCTLRMTLDLSRLHRYGVIAWDGVL